LDTLSAFDPKVRKEVSIELRQIEEFDRLAGERLEPDCSNVKTYSQQKDL